MSEWTPTDDEAASMFITGWCCDTDPETGKTQPDEAWSRWLAAHDRALREQVAEEILDEGCSYPGDMAGEFAEIYARIARGEEQTDE